MPKENTKNPILNPQAESSNTTSSRKEKETGENFASSNKSLKESILELKNQLATIPTTENFATEREKIKTKITAYEIMATPAANDFLSDILAERKKLLPSQGVFSFAQILTREQFYRNWNLPAEINNLIEKEVWNLSWKKVGQLTENSLVFFSELFFFDFKGEQQVGLLSLKFHEEVKIEENPTLSGIFFYIEKALKEWCELLELDAEEIESDEYGEKVFRLKLTKFEVTWKDDIEVNKVITRNFLKYFFGKEEVSMIRLYGMGEEFFKLTNLTKQEQRQAEKIKEIFWLLRILRKDITLAEIAPAGLREQQEFIQNHFKREFTELHKNNPQILDQVQDLPWYNFHPLDADIPETETTAEASQSDLNLDEPDEQELEASQQILEQARKYRDEAVVNIRQQAEEAINESVYNPPLSFDAPRQEYRPPKTCADLHCQTPISAEREYCHFHQWERENDERLNAQRDQVFPNLAPRNPEPNPDLRTTVETDSESQTENPDLDENNPEILPEQAEQGTTEENPRTDKTEPGNTEKETKKTTWEEWKPTLKTAAKWGGGISLTGGLIGVLPAAVGYVAMNAAIADYAAKFCQATKYAIQAGWTAEKLTTAKSAGLSLKTCWCLGWKKFSWAISKVSAFLPVWGWVILGVVAIAGISFLVYKKWDTITSWFSDKKEVVDQTAEKINELILENNFLRSRIIRETESEAEWNQTNQNLLRTNNDINNLRNEVQAWQQRWEEQSQIPTEAEEELTNLRKQLQEQGEKATQLQEELKNFSEDVKTRALAKQKDWEQFRQKADKFTAYVLYVIIILAITFLYKAVRKFFANLFEWTKKENDKELEKVKKRIEIMALELQAQELEQQAKSQKEKSDPEKNQVLTKEEPKTPAETSLPKPKKKTLSESQRDQKQLTKQKPKKPLPPRDAKGRFTKKIASEKKTPSIAKKTGSKKPKQRKKRRQSSKSKQQKI